MSFCALGLELCLGWRMDPSVKQIVQRKPRRDTIHLACALTRQVLTLTESRLIEGPTTGTNSETWYQWYLSS